MIKYGGVELTDVAPVKIDDIVVSPIRLNPVARQRSIAFGADFVRMGGGSRTVTVTFALLTNDQTTRENQLQDIRDWASVNAEKTLELPHYDNRYLECVCTEHPEPSLRKWWEARMRLVFTCFNNPYWTSNQLIEVPCGQVFSIGGSAQPLITIERNGIVPLTDQAYTETSGTGLIRFSTIPAGNMVIDLNRQTASIGGVSFMRNYNPSSVWIVPKVGAYQTITGNGVIKYRERWL